MHVLLHLNFLGLALFFSSALTMTIPQGTNLINLASGLNGTSNSAFVCNKRGTGWTIGPGFADCAGVLRSLPLNPNIGTFYNTGVGNFQLPYFETYKTCQVVIELRSKYDKVQSNWLAVQLAALELNTACQDVRAAPGLGSAYTYVDDLETMKITLKAPTRGLGDGDEVTDANETS